MIESLRRVGEESIRVLRQQAEKEATELQAAAVQKLGDLRKQHADQLSVVCGEESRRALAEGASRARVFRLAAEQTLSDSLYSIARFSLRQLRDDRYPAVFEKLVKELPQLSWKVVRVNAADVDLAKRFFPDADISPVSHIAGGVDVSIDDGTIRVINTFEKRLERAWAELLPQMVGDVYREVSDGTSPEPR